MPDSTPDSPAARPEGLFATTLWTVVLAAGSSESTRARPALERLCRTYWYPIYAQIRRRGYASHDAQDLAQGFFAHLLARNRLHDLSPDKGRFRSFLLAALGNYLSDDRDRQQAVRRGGGQPVLSLDETAAEGRYVLEPATGATPEKDFDRRWALAVLEHALDALAREQTAAGKQYVFNRLRTFLVEATGSRDYVAVAAGIEPAAQHRGGDRAASAAALPRTGPRRDCRNAGPSGRRGRRDAAPARGRARVKELLLLLGLLL